jgi:DNA polymerase-3 subunit delta
VRSSPDALPSGLARGLRSAYLITGTEPLLIAEACDAVRSAARGRGYADREVHFAERGFDWDSLLAETANLSLFASLRLLELRFGSAPDAAGQKALAGLAAQPPADTLLLVSGELEWRQQKSAWVSAFEHHGVLVVAQPVERTALPSWIRGRLASRGLTITPDAAEMLADRVEGNLLAAQQEIERVALLMPGATIGSDEVAALVADSARYDVFELSAAALSGQPARALRILAGLRAEGREPPLVLWALLNDLRALSAVAWRAEHERSLDAIFRDERIWARRQSTMKSALPRFTRDEIESLLVSAAAVDRISKGAMRGDPWVALESLVGRIAGVRLAA